MPKSEKKRSSKKNKTNSVHSVTFHGLQHWYQHKFETFGWMILAKRDGYTDKVMEYHNSVKRLHTAIIDKLESIRDKDKKDDLEIMKENVEHLLEHIKEDFDE